MEKDEESQAIAALSGFGLNHFLSSAGLPSADIYASQLGLRGHPSITSNEIYEDRSDDEDGGEGDDAAIGADVGEDMEEDVEPEPYLETHTGTSDAKGYQSGATAEAPPMQRRRKTRTVKRMVERPKSVYERYPSFQPGRTLDFSELFKGFINRKSRISKRPFHVYPVYPYRKEVPRGFLQNAVNEAQRDFVAKKDIGPATRGHVDDELHDQVNSILSNVPEASGLSLRERTFDPVLLSNWEAQIIYSPSDLPTASPFSHGLEGDRAASFANPTNAALESGEWTKSIIWAPKVPFRDFTQLDLHELDDVVNDYQGAGQDSQSRKRARTDQGPPRDRFNLSNDHLYDLPKHLGARHRVRQTFGQLEVEHAYPALKLQLPFYKTRLSKQDARSFHRPPLQFHANVECRFSKVRTAKKKKDKSGRTIGKGGDATQAIRFTSDLSLRESTNFVLWEYSEEHPPILSNFGMGSMIVNYYRKKTDHDDHVPKADYGEAFVLEPSDDSPFMRFGYVYQGQTVPTMYNNLIRAPLFRHKAYSTDFLVIRTSTKGDVRYYLREIKSMFTIGQNFPITEVPGPHSRKITTTVKHRLQIIAFKLLRKSPEERLKINRLMKYFPDQNELQMRQRLKEFMEYHRRGPHQGFWRLKSNVTIPSDQEMLKMLTPESVVLAESMQVGQRHLQDSGYGQSSEQEDGDESNLSIEQQLAPWITSKNFLQAAQNKAMLKLHGDGDPSGRGEAFSFIRVSMKDIFVRAGEDYDQKMAEADNRPKHAHRYNVAEQQVIYRSEVERIWKAQQASLSRKEEPELSEEDEQPPVSGPSKRFRRETSSALLEGSPPSVNSPLGGGGPASPAYSRGSSLDRDMSLGPDGGAAKVLRIRRLVDGQWETEIVRDTAVINAYVRRRQIIEEETTKADALAPTGDAERDKRARKRLEEEIARMKKNQERRLMRKNAKIIKEGGTPLQLRRPMKPDTTRRCGLCGQVGHMKTNRKCPKWAEANMGVAPPSINNSGIGGSTIAPLTPIPATSPPAQSPASDHYLNAVPLRATPSHGPSPLATSPPLTGIAVDGGDERPVAGPPKIRLTLKK